MENVAQKTIETKDESNYYWVNVICGNCSLRESLAFKKGVLITQHECPDCGVKELKKPNI